MVKAAGLANFLSFMESSPPKMAASSPNSTSTYSSTRSPTAVDVSTDDKDLQDLRAYMYSTDFVPHLANDHATVASGKTVGTSYTASTRKSRRPGQAKMRLQQQKIGETASITRRIGNQQPQRGWQETMQQAAADTNQTWDPHHGWKGYVTGGAASVSDVRSQVSPDVLSPPRPNRSHQRPRTEAPLMIDVEGENEKINIFDNLHDDGPYFEI